MSARYFLDTNVFAYTFDERSPVKQSRSRELVSNALAGHGVISFQVVQEFLNISQRKFRRPLSAEQASTYLTTVLAPLCVVHSSAALYHDGLSVKLRWGFSWYDSLIVAAAKRASCRTLYTEDLQDGQDLEGLRIVNPFR